MLKIVNIPMFEHPNSFSALMEEVEQPLESLNVLSKHKLEKFSVANSSDSEADDIEQFVSKMEYGGVQPGCDNIEPPGLMNSADVSDNALKRSTFLALLENGRRNGWSLQSFSESKFFLRIQTFLTLRETVEKSMIRCKKSKMKDSQKV